MNRAQSPSRITDPDTLAAWADHQRANRRAHRYYVALPIAHQRHLLRRCTCGRRAALNIGVCFGCLLWIAAA